MELDLRRLNSITQTEHTRKRINPEIALEMLKEGNKRFMAKDQVDRNLLQQVEETSGEGGQKPFATVLSCIDSRVSSEIIFDQGIGDIFSVRIAGNFINNDILGSMEFACRLAGTKIIVVLGHTACGAIKGACNGAELGHLTGLLDNLMPAVDAVEEPTDENLRNGGNASFVNNVSKKNVELNMQRILDESEVLAKMVEDKEILLVGGMYDISSGKVTFYS